MSGFDMASAQFYSSHALLVHLVAAALPRAPHANQISRSRCSAVASMIVLSKQREARSITPRSSRNIRRTMGWIVDPHRPRHPFMRATYRLAYTLLERPGRANAQYLGFVKPVDRRHRPRRFALRL
jgi:hypothetical protein